MRTNQTETGLTLALLPNIIDTSPKLLLYLANEMGSSGLSLKCVVLSKSSSKRMNVECCNDYIKVFMHVEMIL